jgi:rod shape-determining protein MreD
VTILFLLVKGDLVGRIVPRYLDVDLVIIIFIYLFVFYGEKGAGVFAFGMGVLTDLFSGGFFGFYKLIYLILFLIIRFGSRPLDLSSIETQAIIVFSAVLLRGVLMITFLYLFSLRTIFTFSDFFAFILSAACTGLIAPFLFYLFNYLNRFAFSVTKEL